MMNPSLLKNLAISALLATGAYILLFWSPHTLGEYVYSKIKLVIFIVPWLALWIVYGRQVITRKDNRIEICCILAIVILGAFNTWLSDSPGQSILTMRTFLLTGIFAFWASMMLLTDEPARRIFDYFCCGCLAVIGSGELIRLGTAGLYGAGVFQVFSLHAIPLGTVIILLSTGPLMMLTARPALEKLAGGLVILMSGAVIYLAHKRGTWVALAVMGAAAMLYLARRRKRLVVLILLALALLAPLQAARLYARLDPGIPHYLSILNRLELYPFALHIWKTHPVMGMGLRSLTQERYVADYQPYNQDLAGFYQTVAQLQTFDNMFLTALVELGTLLTLCYAVLIIVILARYLGILRGAAAPRPVDWYRLLVVLGFAVHSLSYDSLLLPPVNWLFHVQLGIMAGYRDAPAAACRDRLSARDA